jgi:ABC-type amino acid transport system permease subunit
MLNEPFGRDVVVLITAAVAGAVVAIATTPKGSRSEPSWAVRAYLWIFRAFPPFRTAAPRTYSYREQFSAAFFLSFFVVFIVGVLAFGCSYRLGCR